ncbi:hypothetical protein PVAP13_7KG223800 [Panicum virgatum]|uniref:Uncharacterized protein n=1 Tax=Panicum virgatum TaxID=38727 RepID=A0A8T0QNP9_PANVG|nr:hypothetical protein PVAP13_7KG223800 [Panicum virgatum]
MVQENHQKERRAIMSMGKSSQFVRDESSNSQACRDGSEAAAMERVDLIALANS